MIFKTQTFQLLFPIILVAFLLRFLSPFMAPPSLNWDEVSLGYNAYSILQTGKDEWNRFLPLTFEAFGDFKLPGYIYTLVPFIALFGLHDWVIRIPSNLAGVISVVLLFLVVLEITKDRKWAILASLLLAISPWHVFFSRMALEANLAFSFFLSGLWLFLIGIRKKQLPSFIMATVLWGITLFTYNSARVFVPLFLLSLFVIYRKELISFKTKLIIPLTILVFFVGLAFGLAVFQDSSSRYYWVTILDQGAINYLNESRSTSQFPDLITKLIYNRYVYFVQHFFTNYLSHFSLEFLFLKGGSNYQFSVPNTGLLYIIELPFLLLGLFKLFTQKKSGWIFLTWFFLSPIPSAITREAPHALRAIFMLGAIQVITGYGLTIALNFILQKKAYIYKLGISIVGVILLISVLTHFYTYFVVYPQKYSDSWQYGMKEVVGIIDKYTKQGKTVFVSKRYGEPHIFYLFYNKYPPQKYQNNPTLVRYPQTNWRWVDRIDSIYFVNDWEVKEKLVAQKGDILIASASNYPENSRVLESIFFLNGSRAFDIVEIQ